ncbi:hypothetical protein CDD80_5540 [Ophiocordyceps camponoti-rufipedis]|uniref:Uncharacterized protein n=1 Tax=Ophiocordyceps camponoti-rufipedis TaxID=2004952 RepID=A0A2C5XG15_9HYPO|nr:hypothetical protein CDD80_5540 [Ophiocordyceps camponoti-rufipedis]
MEDATRKRRRVVAESTASVAEDETRRKRPSFASPTKSSLARFNPAIPNVNRGEGSLPAGRRGSDAGSDGSLSELMTPQPGVAVEDVAPASEPDRREVEMREADRLEPRSDRVGRAGPAAKPNPRPLPPPAPEGEDELNPFMGHALRRSPVTGISIPPPPEPELPPSVPDPLLSTPPRGIHSSPSRWKGKSKAKKSSPLKAPAEAPKAGPSDILAPTAPSRQPEVEAGALPDAESRNMSGEGPGKETEAAEPAKKSGPEPSRKPGIEPVKNSGETKGKSGSESRKKSGAEQGKKSGAQPSKKSGAETSKKSRSEPSKKAGAEPTKKPGAEHGKKSTGSPSGSLREADPPCGFDLDPTTSRARLVAARNPDQDKLKERDELRAEIARLKSDLKLAGAENERLRLMQSSGRSVASTDENAYLDLLRRDFEPDGLVAFWTTFVGRSDDDYN